TEPLAKVATADGYPQLMRAGILIAPLRGIRGTTAFRLLARGQTMTDFAAMLRNLLHSHVVDKTGIEGQYDFAVDYLPENVPIPDPAINPGILPGNLPTAVEDMGLKLTRARLPLDVIIVESGDKTPSEN